MTTTLSVLGKQFSANRYEMYGFFNTCQCPILKCKKKEKRQPVVVQGHSTTTAMGSSITAPSMGATGCPESPYFP